VPASAKVLVNDIPASAIKNDRSHDCLVGKGSSRAERDKNPKPAADRFLKL